MASDVSVQHGARLAVKNKQTSFGRTTSRLVLDPVPLSSAHLIYTMLKSHQSSPDATSGNIRCKFSLTDSLFADIPLSVGIMEPCSQPLHLNTIEFLWDPAKNASVFIQVPEDSARTREETRSRPTSSPRCLSRSTASALSSPPESMAGRRVCPSESKWTLLPPTNTANTSSMSILQAARSKSSR